MEKMAHSITIWEIKTNIFLTLQIIIKSKMTKETLYTFFPILMKGFILGRTLTNLCKPN